MNAIIEQTKKTISDKKQEIESLQNYVNESIFRANRKVNGINELKNEVNQLEGELRAYFEANTCCAVGLTPPPNPLYGKDETPIAYKKI
jgi:chromosome segregation ATPase